MAGLILERAQTAWLAQAILIEQAVRGSVKDLAQLARQIAARTNTIRDVVD